MLNSSARLAMVDAREFAILFMLVSRRQERMENALISFVWVCLLVSVKKHPMLLK